MSKRKGKVIGQLYQIGKSKFLIFSSENNFHLYRLVRGQWTLLEVCETEEGAERWILVKTAKISDFRKGDEKSHA